MIYTDSVHLVGDSTRELHAFARSVGLKRQWFQDHKHHPHYDITTARMLKKILNTGKTTTISSKSLLKRFPAESKKGR